MRQAETRIERIAIGHQAAGEDQIEERISARLYVMPSDGSGSPRFVTTASIITRPTWDPTGRFIAFAEIAYSLTTGSSEFWLTDDLLGDTGR